MIIEPMWVTRFISCKNIVSRTQTLNLIIPATKLKIIHGEVAYHLVNLIHNFRAGRIQDDNKLNGDEILVYIHLLFKNTLAFRGDTEVNYS